MDGPGLHSPAPPCSPPPAVRNWIIVKAEAAVKAGVAVTGTVNQAWLGGTPILDGPGPPSPALPCGPPSVVWNWINVNAGTAVKAGVAVTVAVS